MVRALTEIRFMRGDHSPGQPPCTGRESTLRRGEPLNAANVLDRAGATVEAARVVTERSREMRLQMTLSRPEREPVKIAPENEARLRKRLGPKAHAASASYQG
jgi:hypothetical protein